MIESMVLEVRELYQQKQEVRDNDNLVLIILRQQVEQFAKRIDDDDAIQLVLVYLVFTDKCKTTQYKLWKDFK